VINVAHFIFQDITAEIHVVVKSIPFNLRSASEEMDK